MSNTAWQLGHFRAHGNGRCPVLTAPPMELQSQQKDTLAQPMLSPSLLESRCHSVDTGLNHPVPRSRGVSESTATLQRSSFRPWRFNSASSTRSSCAASNGDGRLTTPRHTDSSSIASVLNIWALRPFMDRRLLALLCVWLAFDAGFWTVSTVRITGDATISGLFVVFLVFSLPEAILAHVFLVRVSRMLHKHRWYLGNVQEATAFHERVRTSVRNAALFVTAINIVNCYLTMSQPYAGAAPSLGRAGMIYAILSESVLSMLQLGFPLCTAALLWRLLELMREHVEETSAVDDRSMLRFWQEISVRLDTLSAASSPFLALLLILTVASTLTQGWRTATDGFGAYNVNQVWELVFLVAHLAISCVVLHRAAKLAGTLTDTCNRLCHQKLFTNPQDNALTESRSAVTAALLMQAAQPSYRVFSIKLTLPVLQSMAAAVVSVLLSLVRFVGDN